MAKEFKELHSVDELDRAIGESNRRPVLLFKHSLTCPISERAFSEFQSYLKSAGPQISGNLITVQTDRPLSNEVAERLGIPHETPQAILLHNGRVVWDASHFDITAPALAEAIGRTAP